MTAITKGSPAEAARFEPGDIILSFNGVQVEDDGHLINVVSLTEVGRRVPVLVYRDGKTLTLTVTVGDRNRFEP